MWIKRSEYEELIGVRDKYNDIIKVIHNTESGKVTYCKFGVFMPNNVHDSYSNLIVRLREEVNVLKEKALNLEANLDYYKRKCGELMNE